jgi:hypothetical protein
MSLEGFSVTFDNQHVGAAPESVVDAWELKAARRALLNLRKLLHDQPMLDLLKSQIEATDVRMKAYLAQSNGRFRLARTTGIVRGLTSAQFFKWMMENFRAAMPGMSTPDERLASVFKIGYPMHPEHYVAMPKYTGIVETMGGTPLRSRVLPYRDQNEAPDFVRAEYNDAFPHKLPGKAELDDGTCFCYAMHQFRDTPDGKGFEMQLNIWWPDACPQIFFDEHEEHFSVEFRNGIRMAAEEILGCSGP